MRSETAAPHKTSAISNSGSYLPTCSCAKSAVLFSLLCKNRPRYVRAMLHWAGAWQIPWRTRASRVESGLGLLLSTGIPVRR
jgi:hypothetical protein